MGSRNQYEGIDALAVKIIRNKASQLVGRSGFVEADLQDLEQELVMDLQQRLPRFDPNRAGRKTFITYVVKHRVATLIKAQEAGNRDYRLRAFSLDRDLPLEDDEPDPVKGQFTSPLLDQTAYLLQTGAAARSETESKELCMDLKEMLKILPPELRDLCRRLVSQTVTEVCHDTGIPRATLYGAIQKVRKIFEEAGLDAYL